MNLNAYLSYCSLDIPHFQDIYCQFGIFDDSNLTQTQVAKASNQINFNFSKKFDAVVTKEVNSNYNI